MARRSHVDSGSYDSFWNLRVVCGDQITIDWENHNGYGQALLVYPADGVELHMPRAKQGPG